MRLLLFFLAVCVVGVFSQSSLVHSQAGGDFSRLFAEQFRSLSRGEAIQEGITDRLLGGSAPASFREAGAVEERGHTATTGELGRARGRIYIPRYEPTLLESDFSLRAGFELRQFGYNLFESKDKTNTTGKNQNPGGLQDDYVLGIGDELLVTFRGQVQRTGVVSVDRQGRIILRDLSPISAAGRTFRDFREELEARTEMALLGTEVFISLSKIKTISVLVVGEVREPGFHKTSAFSSLLDAIAMAGGIKRTGSLRKLQVVRGDHIFWLDLYELIFMGTMSRNLLLRDGDRIVVPTIGDTVAAAGWLNRPGIYELAEGDRANTLADLIALGGGTVRPKGSRLIHISLQSDGRQIVNERKEAQKVKISAGDILLVEISENIQLGSVKTVGHVRVPNRRSLSASPTVSALLAGGSILDSNAYLLLAAVETTDTQTRARRLYPVNLQDVLSGVVDYRLLDEDVVIIFSSSDIDYLRSMGVQQVLMNAGKDDYKGSPCRALQELEATIALSGSGKFNSSNLYLDSIARTGGEDKLTLGETLELQRLDLEERRILLKERGQKLVEMQARMEAEPIEQRDLLEKNLAGQEDKDKCPAIFESYPRSLAFLLEHTVLLQGQVRTPGIYPISGLTSLGSIVSVAQGLSRTANLTNVEVIRYSTSETTAIRSGDREILDLSGNKIFEVQISPGDVVQVGKRFNNRGSGFVTLKGQFQRPGRYTVNKDDRLSDVIRRAGGLTSQAYPYGAVFARESAKLREREGYKRSALELEEKALAISISGVSSITRLAKGPDARAIKDFTERLRNITPIGRVVIEADPRVLEAQPALDLLLEPGDVLYIPKIPGSVTVTGDVLSPGALQYAPGIRADQYLKMAGGIGESGDKSAVFAVLPNGAARPIEISYWSNDSAQIPPGTTLVVPRSLDSFDFITLAKDLTQIFSQLAIGAASLAVLTAD